MRDDWGPCPTQDGLVIGPAMPADRQPDDLRARRDCAGHANG